MVLTTTHNLANLTARNALNETYKGFSEASERLSTGYRINAAADDAAGLAVRELMRADIAAMDQGKRNANDGISMIQTADGALGTVDELMNRMKELSMQAATGTYTEEQRIIVDSEFSQMASEITRIGDSAEFNGVKLLDGSLSSGTGMNIHFGKDNSDQSSYSMQIAKIDAPEFSLNTSISLESKASAMLSTLDVAIKSKDGIRASLGAYQNRLEKTVANITSNQENLQAAEAQISDTDIPTEMAKFTSSMSQLQGGRAMFSQTQGISQLLTGLIG